MKLVLFELELIEVAVMCGGRLFVCFNSVNLSYFYDVFS